MSQQDYDFFATGREQPAPVVPSPPPATRPGQYGGAVDPQGRPVNQFGTPIGEAAAPVGPNAAPGYGAAPVASPGMNSAWSGPPLHPAHAAPAWGPPQGAPVYAGAASDRPGMIVAAGVIGIVQGVLAGFVGLFALLAIGALEPELQGTARVQGMLGVARLIAFLILVVGVGYVVAGIATALGKRWAAWTLLVVESLGLALGLVGLLDSSVQPTGNSIVQLSSLLIPAAVVLLLVMPASMAWLRRR